MSIQIADLCRTCLFVKIPHWRCNVIQTSSHFCGIPHTMLQRQTQRCGIPVSRPYPNYITMLNNSRCLDVIDDQMTGTGSDVFEDATMTPTSVEVRTSPLIGTGAAPASRIVCLKFPSASNPQICYQPRQGGFIVHVYWQSADSLSLV